MGKGLHAPYRTRDGANDLIVREVKVFNIRTEVDQPLEYPSIVEIVATKT